VTGTYYAVTSQNEERWLIWLAGIALVGASLGALWPDRVPLLFGLLGLVTIAAMIVRLFIDRHMRPEAAVTLDEKHE
jgi:hypothetical protein